MSDIPYWQTRGHMKNGKDGVFTPGKPAPVKQETEEKRVITPKKKKRRIKQKSKKTAKRDRKLAKDYGPFIEAHPVCEIRSPDCTHVTTCVHHTDGRGLGEVHDQKTWKGACSPCNLYVETHHKWAEERGFKNRRTHKKNNSENNLRVIVE